MPPLRLYGRLRCLDVNVFIFSLVATQTASSPLCFQSVGTEENLFQGNQFKKAILSHSNLQIYVVYSSCFGDVMDSK